MLATSSLRHCRWVLLNLTLCRGFHDLLPIQNPCSLSHLIDNGDDRSFLRCMKRAGIGQIAFVRHGQTAKALDGSDYNRQLTDEGRRQAHAAGESFGRSLLRPYYAKALTSPAPRTVDTASIFLRAAAYMDDETKVEIHPLPIAYDGTMQPEGSKLFQKHGYAPLHEYLDNPNIVDREVAQGLLSNYAYNVACAMVDAVIPEQEECRETTEHHETDSSSSTTATLLFVGHAIYLPALALGVTSLVRESNGCSIVEWKASTDILLTTNTREAEGYLVNLQPRHPEGLVQYLSGSTRSQN